MANWSNQHLTSKYEGIIRIDQTSKSKSLRFVKKTA